ncbi:hypothetical protein A0J61_09762 [Choanephora cucurbitarum]|uniref:Uncharacterized protein n=1 Tax=Choanephora cucurbitarum TaxID=101091 RepID=A0A1C7MZL9_9FUNG|nr:hypothetical protein A0J61_09762 [Choanephora cucurbitarum]
MISFIPSSCRKHVSTRLLMVGRKFMKSTSVRALQNDQKKEAVTVVTATTTTTNDVPYLNHKHKKVSFRHSTLIIWF